MNVEFLITLKLWMMLLCTVSLFIANGNSIIVIITVPFSWLDLYAQNTHDQLYRKYTLFRDSRRNYCRRHMRCRHINFLLKLTIHITSSFIFSLLYASAPSSYNMLLCTLIMTCIYKRGLNWNRSNSQAINGKEIPWLGKKIVSHP